MTTHTHFIIGSYAVAALAIAIEIALVFSARRKALATLHEELQGDRL